MARGQQQQTESADVTAANDAEAAKSEWVHIARDGDSGDPARVTRKSFDKKWSAKGYKVVDPSKATTQTGTEADSSE